MDAVEYFTLLAQLMKTNPPAAADAPALARFARIGLVPGQDFDAGKLNADFAKRIPEIAFDRIMLQFKINTDVQDINGWGYTTKTGIYGTDYLMRALVTAIGLGANRPQDAVYPTSLKDADGRAYDGAEQIRHPLRKGPDCRRSRASGRSPCMTTTTSSSTTRSTATRSAPRQDLKANADGSVDLLHPARVAGRRQGVELAAGAGRQVHPDDAALLAERERSLDPRRQLDHPSGRGSRLSHLLGVWRRPRSALAAYVARAFQEKVATVFRPELRKNKDLERSTDSKKR